MLRGIIQLRLVVVLATLLLLGGCSSSEDDVFVPFPRKQENTESARPWEALNPVACRDARVSLKEDDILTQQNFEAVFQCANYDGKLEQLRALVQSGELPNLVNHANAMMGSSGLSDLKATLEPWFKIQSNGQSDIDRLLPLVSSTIKNNAFQKSLPVFHQLLDAGMPVWAELLPKVAEVFEDPRWPRVMERMPNLWKENFQEEASAKKSAEFWKEFAGIVQMKLPDGKTFARHMLELGGSLNTFSLSETSIQEYFYRLNNRLVLQDYFTARSDYRLEEMNSKMHEIPFQDETNPMTPDERKQEAVSRLFRGGKNSPLAQLIRTVEKLNKRYNNFLPQVVAWYDNEKTGRKRIRQLIRDFVLTFQIDSGLKAIHRPSSNLSKYLEKELEDFSERPGVLISAAEWIGEGTSCEGKENRSQCKKILRKDDRVTRICGLKMMKGCIRRTDFLIFINSILSSPTFEQKLAQEIYNQNKEVFGLKNADLIPQEEIARHFMDLYRSEEFGNYVSSWSYGEKSKEIGFYVDSLKGFLVPFLAQHKTDIVFAKSDFSSEKNLNFNKMELAIWTSIARKSLGEDVIFRLGQTLSANFLSEVINDESVKSKTLAQWALTSTYSNPSTLEDLLVLVNSKTPFLRDFRENKEYLKKVIVPEIFKNNKENIALGRELIDQLDNYILYIRSGFARTGKNLGRAMSIKDASKGPLKGYFVNTYTDIISQVSQRKLEGKVVQLWDVLCQNKVIFCDKREVDLLQELDSSDRAEAAATLTYFFKVLFQPRVKGDYSTTLMESLLTPVRRLLEENQLNKSEAALLALATEIESIPQSELENFFLGIKSLDVYDRPLANQNIYPEIAKILRKERLPDVIQSLNRLFSEDAVQPALQYLANRIEDGQLQEFLLFIRRVLGIKQ